MTREPGEACAFVGCGRRVGDVVGDKVHGSYGCSPSHAPNLICHPFTLAPATAAPAVCRTCDGTGCVLCDYGGEPAAPPAVDGDTWRVGRRVGRTIYLGDTLIGVMDTPELAALVVEAVNGRR